MSTAAVYATTYGANLGGSSSFMRRHRDSSLGAAASRTSSFRNSSVGRGDSYSYRNGSSTPSPIIPRRTVSRDYRDSWSPVPNRSSVMVFNSSGQALGSETAKYQRNEAMKEIHSNFMRQFEQTQRKRYNNNGGGGGNEDDSSERLSRARAKIIGLPSSTDPNDYMARRECLNGMYTEMSRFSTRTVAMVNDMSDRSSYKSKDQYKWRKDMAEYEKSGELDKEVRIRNIENRYKKRREKMREQEEEEEKERSDKQKARQAAIAKARAEREALLAEAAHQQKPPIPARSAAKQVKEKEETRKIVQIDVEPPKVMHKEEPKMEPAPAPKKDDSKSPARKAAKIEMEPQQAATTGRRSWRDKMNAAKESSNVTVPEEKKVTIPAAAPEKENDDQGNNKENIDNSNNSNKDEKNKIEDDDDLTGTKSMRSDVNSLFSNMEAEFEAGKSKLAKLRERIRKARGVIKAADDAVEQSKN